MAERRSLVRRWQLVMRFAAASLIVFLVIGAGLSMLISRQLVDREREIAEAHAEFVTNSILRYELSPQDLSFLAPMKGPRYQEVLGFVQSRILQYPLVLVKIWRSDGTVVFSNDRNLVGRTFQPLSDHLREAFYKGMAVSSVEDTGEEAENASVWELPPRVLETYVPVFIYPGRNEGPPVAVVETYTDYAVVQAQVDRVLRTVLVMLVGGLAVLFVLLLPIARRISRRLEEQAERLGDLLKREQAAQSDRRGLLDRTLRAAEEEGTRIAAELHDGPVQRLARIGYGLERVRMRRHQPHRDDGDELLVQMQGAVFDEVGNLRRLMSRLRPPVLDQRGLEDAIRDRAQAITVEFDPGGRRRWLRVRARSGLHRWRSFRAPGHAGASGDGRWVMGGRLQTGPRHSDQGGVASPGGGTMTRMQAWVERTQIVLLEAEGRSPHNQLPAPADSGATFTEALDPSAMGDFEDSIEEMEGPAPRIMLVDDDQGFREMLRDLLVEDGFEVVGEASDGGEAARLASELMPDVILMDLRMPNVDGIEGARLLKTLLPLVQIIMLSAYGDLGLQRGAQEAGVYCYLIKGCPPGMIREMLRFAWKYKLGLERGGSIMPPPAETWGQDDLDASFGPNPGWGSEEPRRTHLT